jgi:hypothetical protein
MPGIFLLTGGYLPLRRPPGDRTGAGGLSYPSVIPKGMTLDDAELKAAVDFQERFFASDMVCR